MSPNGAGGGASGTLANLVVQFVTQGQKELKQSLDDIQMAIGAVVLAVQKFNTQTIEALEKTKGKTKEAATETVKLGEAFQKAATTINVAVGAGVAVIGGFVRQGLAAGSMGMVLSFQMERLALTLSGLFRPEIQKLTDMLGRLTDWINRLSESQKKTIAYFIEGAAAALAVGLILPRIATGIKAIIVAVAGLTKAIVAGEIATGFGAILPILGLMVQGIVAFTVGTEQGRSMFRALAAAVKPVADAVKALFGEFKGDMSAIGNSLADGIYHAAHAMSQLVSETINFINKTGAIRETIDFLSKSLAGWALLLKVIDVKFFGGKNRPAFAPAEEGSRGAEMRRGGGFESLSATYERIALAALRASSGGRSPEERTADGIDEANKTLDRIQMNTGTPRSHYTV